MKKKHLTSTDNIFEDLGLEDSEEISARSDLMSEVVNIIRNSEIPQKEFAVILGVSEPKISALMTGKINDFSNDTLLNYLMRLGCNVEIKVLPQFHLSKPGMKGVMKVKGSVITKRPMARTRKPKSKV